MLDCWKNNCHGATVVPTMATISSNSVEFRPPGKDGINPCAVSDTDGWTMNASGKITMLMAISAKMKRSQRRNEPPATTANSRTAASGTEMALGSPK